MHNELFIENRPKHRHRQTRNSKGRNFGYPAVFIIKRKI